MPHSFKSQFWRQSFKFQSWPHWFELQSRPQASVLASLIRASASAIWTSASTSAIWASVSDIWASPEPQLSALQPQRPHSSSWKRCQSSSPIKILLLCQSYLVVSSLSDYCLNQNLQSSASSNSCQLVYHTLTVGDSCAYMSLFTHPSLICKFICLLSCGNWSLENCSAMLCPTTYRLSSTRKVLSSIKRVFQPCLNLGGSLCCWFSVLLVLSAAGSQCCL